MSLPVRVLLFMVLALAACPSALAQDLIGTVRTLEGVAQIVHNGMEQTPEVGSPIFPNDTLVTKDGALGVLFRDDTSITLGANTTIIVDEFVFDPAQDNIKFATRMVKGSALFVTGQIAKINPQAFALETPKATIGIRGTRFIVDLD